MLRASSRTKFCAPATNLATARTNLATATDGRRSFAASTCFLERKIRFAGGVDRLMRTLHCRTRVYQIEPALDVGIAVERLRLVLGIAQPDIGRHVGELNSRRPGIPPWRADRRALCRDAPIP